MSGWNISPKGRLILAFSAVIACWAVQLGLSRRADRPTQSGRAIQVARGGRISMDRCSRCHPGACEGGESVPHSRTLRAGNDPDVLALFAGHSYRRASDGPKVSFEERNGELWMTSDSCPESIRVDWMFGSGRHAMTPVSLMVNPNGATELIEGGVSWFHGGVFGPTPGASSAGARGIAALGTPHDHPTTLECFGCHVTELRLDQGLVQPAGVVAGIGCERCHPGSERHASSMEQGGPPLIERWSDLTPLESVNRCGECHRRADHLTREELSPERPVLVRFASIGLVMSRCFQGQESVRGIGKESRLDCMTCHDPHHPGTDSTAATLTTCTNCHGSRPEQTRSCSSPQSTADCLGCHMPAVNVTEDLVLTDHWIRPRTAADPPVAKPRHR